MLTKLGLIIYCTLAVHVRHSKVRETVRKGQGKNAVDMHVRANKSHSYNTAISANFSVLMTAMLQASIIA